MYKIKINREQWKVENSLDIANQKTVHKQKWTEMKGEYEMAAWEFIHNKMKDDVITTYFICNINNWFSTKTISYVYYRPVGKIFQYSSLLLINVLGDLSD